MIRIYCDICGTSEQHETEKVNRNVFDKFPPYDWRVYSHGPTVVSLLCPDCMKRISDGVEGIKDELYEHERKTKDTLRTRRVGGV